MQVRFYLAASAAALSVASVFATPAFAQQITSGIEGTVVDDAGAPVVGATVEVTDTRTGNTRTLKTGATGSFNATGLTTGGPYTVAISATGFEGQSIENLETSIQGNTSLAFTLSAGTGEIVVTGTRVRVTQLAVGPGQSFSSEVIENAPTFNRDVRDIIRIDPRVSLDRDDTGSGQDRISCLGGNDRGNAFTVDGISQGDVYGLNDTGFSSRSSTPLPYDAIRETQVQFAPFDVDYGQFTGCAINVVTKSGSNDYSFGAFYEYSSSDLRADNVFDKYSGRSRNVAPIEPDKRWGAYLGGPIIKDKLFVFGAYENQKAGQSQDDGPAGAGYPNSITGVPVAEFNRISEILNRVYKIDTGELVTSRPFTNKRYFARADWQINDDHRFEATYQRLEESTTRADDFSNSSTNPRVTGVNTFYLSGTKSNYYSGRLYSQWTDAFSTELRYSRSQVQDLQDPVGGGEAQSGTPIPAIVVGIANADGTFGRVSAGPGFSRSANDLQTKIEQYRAVGKLDAGDHQIKFGGEMNRANLFNLFVQNATGTLFFRNAADLEAGLLSTGSNTNPTAAQLAGGIAVGAAGNFSATGDVNDAAAKFNRSIYSIFVQDDWQVTDSLSVVGGVRAEWYDGGAPESNPLFINRYGFSNGNGFSKLPVAVLPRVAFTYDLSDFSVFSRGQLRAGLGIFSGGDPLVWFGNAFQNDGSTVGEGTTRSLGCPLPTTAQIDVVTGGTFTGVPACIKAAGSTEAARGLGDTQSISPNLKQPTVLRFNAGFSSQVNFAETGFFSGWDLTLDYIYSKYRNPFNLVDMAAVPATAAGTGGAAIGLNGFTIDGRPIYRSIDPSATGCSARLTSISPAPAYSGINAACFNTSRDDELMLTNAGSFRSHTASFILSKNFEGGVFTEGGSTFFNVGYSFSDSQDRRNMYSSTAGSNYDISAASDRQNPAASRGFYNSRHNFTLSTNFKEEFFGDYATRFGVTFVARSGRPYSLTFSGGSVFGDSVSGTENALVYLPTGVTDPNVAPTSNMTAVQGLADFGNSLSCARKFVGKTIERNTCSNDWYYDLDLSFSQEIPGPGRLFGREDKLKLFASFDNFLNLLDPKWNVQRRRDFGGRQDIASISGIDTQGRYIITGFSANTLNSERVRDFDADNFINTSSSVWRIKVGVSYDF
ncbi:carboxypeptidase regulatory-like domain-containing protein [Sphingorhabdus sp.]|jgi:outer membrane receptor for ferrienterochelin and colicin|uniref:TonB-dependent receptor n=1 Tax=Sphingorhabdus sp. TaxID=1902408 RepID=UPI0037CAE356